MTTVYKIGRGETKQFTVTVTSNAGALVDLTNAQIVFTVRDLAGNVVFEKRSTDAGGDDEQVEIPDQHANNNAMLGKFNLKIGDVDSDIAPTARWADTWVKTGAEPPEELKVDEHAPFYVTGDEPPAFT